MFNLEDKIRPHILGLKPYSSARDEYTGKEGVFLDANENPFGSAGKHNYNRYPDPYQHTIKQKIAAIKGIEPSQIFIGNGSDEAIDLLIRLFCAPKKDAIITMPPTYGMYSVSAEINEVNIIEVPLSEEYEIRDKEVLEAASETVKLCFVCSPNNPTGNALDEKKILHLVEKFEGIVVIDEAYIDFSVQESFTKYLPNYSNLVVMQTLSKAWGLAGLRLGMAFASPQLIHFINKIKPPYNISEATQREVLENLFLEEQKNEMVTNILRLREDLKNRLERLPFVKKIYPSDANFLLVKVSDADKMYNNLVNQQVIVRKRSKVHLCEGCLRITIGTATENDSFLKAFTTLG